MLEKFKNLYRPSPGDQIWNFFKVAAVAMRNKNE